VIEIKCESTNIERRFSMISELAELDAMAQAELVRKGEVKPIELVDAAIERIERLNPILNAVVTKFYESARRVAMGPIPDGPFKGVPFLLKDLLAEMAGTRLTEGSFYLENYISQNDSEIVARYKNAGLIILGKTNTPEFGILPTTEPRLFGPTKNPWNTERTPGGSSGGSAAAVASGMVPVAHGNDGGGSIRIPASCCGLFGLKPTRGRNPLGPFYGDIFGALVAEHVLTHSVRDSAALLDVTSGPSIGDPYWATPPKRPFLKEVGAKPRRLRIALITRTATGVPVHPDCINAVNEAASLCSELGHRVMEANIDIDGQKVIQSLMVIWSTGCAWTISDWERRTGIKPIKEMFEPLTWALREMGFNHRAPELLTSLQDLQAVSRKIARWFYDGKWDLILTPTLAEPPVPLRYFDSTPENPMLGMIRAATFIPFTPIFNITGQPAMNIPIYWNKDGLPIGVQFAARFGEEATLFRIASQIEEACPWKGRRPPIFAY
jgi:amidase